MGGFGAPAPGVTKEAPKKEKKKKREKEKRGKGRKRGTKRRKDREVSQHDSIGDIHTGAGSPLMFCRGRTPELCGHLRRQEYTSSCKLTSKIAFFPHLPY